jgi:hypothetical protein
MPGGVIPFPNDEDCKTIRAAEKQMQQAVTTIGKALRSLAKRGAIKQAAKISNVRKPQQRKPQP